MAAKYSCTKCGKDHFETSKIGIAHQSDELDLVEIAPNGSVRQPHSEFGLIYADLVEIDETGAIVPKGAKGRGGIRPPPHTFYNSVVISDPLGEY